ncbi:hypothetical protein CONLIGDRAFT_516937 [Coniochaeta ligniaria NRRL 30616]|uniref:Fungal N-terminal domain-containing protein n=1 Tax=Coniochaeta ligniaria NRRL 30616 TaxID=1408157 RepID=A0A1J7JEP4_9PEZI|nr:hypothetical protein CONLIGDRAFT_516937 [Coniochaeta ligniaria NRRL 30616]
MDPISITTGVLSLIKVCGAVGFALKELHDGAQLAGAKAEALINEVEEFMRVLGLMKSTLEDKKIQTAFQSTGHIGNHWRSIAACLEDGQQTLERLQATLDKASKSVKLLDSTRKHLRLKLAADEIGIYQQRIRTCRDTMQLSIQTVILWNQVSFQESADKILPGLDDLTRFIRILAMDMNHQMARLGGLIGSSHTSEELRSLERMKACVQTASEVVSSASTTLGLDDKASVAAASDFGDIFPPRPSETVQRWMSDNTVPEVDEPVMSQSVPSLSLSSTLVVGSPGHKLDDSDSDGELEIEIVSAHWDNAMLERQRDKDKEAIRHIKAGLARVRRNERYFANNPEYDDVEMNFLDMLLDLHRETGDWEGAKDVGMDRLTTLSRGMARGDDKSQYLAATMDIIEILIQLKDPVQARIYAKKCVKDYKKLGTSGRDGLERSLKLLVETCKMDGEIEEAQAYERMLANLLETNSSPETNSVGSPANPTQQEKTSVSSQDVSVSIPLHPTPKTYRSPSYSVGQMELDESKAERILSNILETNASPETNSVGSPANPTQQEKTSVSSQDVSVSIPLHPTPNTYRPPSYSGGQMELGEARIERTLTTYSTVLQSTPRVLEKSVSPPGDVLTSRRLDNKPAHLGWSPEPNQSRAKLAVPDPKDAADSSDGETSVVSTRSYNTTNNEPENSTRDASPLSMYKPRRSLPVTYLAKRQSPAGPAKKKIECVSLDMTTRSFKEYCTAAGVRYGLERDRKDNLRDFESLRDYLDLEQQDADTTTAIEQLFILLATCQNDDTPSVSRIYRGVPEYEIDQILTQTAKLGYPRLPRQSSQKHKDVTIEIGEKEHNYEFKMEFGFSRTRDWTSIIYRCPDGKLRRYLKGAADEILRQVQGDKPLLEKMPVPRYLKHYTSTGLLTLCLAFQEFSEAEFQSLEEHFHREILRGSLHDWPSRLGGASEVHFLGTIAIEERTAPGVPDDIARLQLAGSAIWGLSQNDRETATRIALRNGLLDNEMRLLRIDTWTSDTTRVRIDQHINSIRTESDHTLGNPIALVISGHALTIALAPRTGLSQRFLELADLCATVICYDLSDFQRTGVVAFVKGLDKPPPLSPPSIFGRVKRTLTGNRDRLR